MRRRASAFTLLEMLVDHVGTRKELLGNSLRLALLSGDWIPVGMPDCARMLMPGMTSPASFRSNL